MTKRDRVAIHAPLLRGYVLVRLSKSHTSPSPLSRCILNGITCTSIMDNAPTCPVCQAELIPKVSGSATQILTELSWHAQMTSRTTVIKGLSSGRSRQNMSHMTGRHVCAEYRRKSKNGAQLTHSIAGMSPLRDVSSHAAQPEFRTSSIVIVLHAVGCTRQKAQLNVCPYHLHQHRHLPWIQHHRAKFHGQIPQHQLKVISAPKT